MNLSESYRQRLQELSGVSGMSEDEQDYELKRLGISKFEDLIGRTVYNVKPTYGLHKVLKWIPENMKYVLFHEGHKVLANPFNIILVPDNNDFEDDSELKWVISKECEKPVKSLKINEKYIDDEMNLYVNFDVIFEDNKGSTIVEVSWQQIILRFRIVSDKLGTYCKDWGDQRILKSSDGDTQGRWDSHPPFISPIRLDSGDEKRMKKIIERIILEMI